VKEEKKRLFLVWKHEIKRWKLYNRTQFSFNMMKIEGWVVRENVLDLDNHPTDQEIWDALCVASTFKTYNDERQDNGN